jgi:uncharacterized protein
MGLILPARPNEFTVVLISILLQSLPFLLLGIFASALVQRYLPAETLMRWLPRRPLPLILLSSAAGFVAPVCDCGVIPLARRLMGKGVPVYAATTLIIAAPVVNPIVLLSTVVAFQGDWRIVALRVSMTLSVAVVVGLLVRSWFPDSATAAPGAPERGGPPAAASAYARETRQHHGPGIVAHASAEFFEVSFYVILGSVFTAATQTLLPRGDLMAIGGTRVMSIVALMPVATLLSICSEADAFVARAFASTFSVGAVLAFMTIGQIVDLRMGFLLFRTLRGGIAALIVGLAYVIVFTQALVINGLLGVP